MQPSCFTSEIFPIIRDKDDFDFFRKKIWFFGLYNIILALIALRQLKNTANFEPAIPSCWPPVKRLKT